jgi:2-dehydropantoate 2-reductase
MTKEKLARKKFLVIGLGPIGGILCCHLKSSGCIIYGVDLRKDLVKAIQEDGISITGATSCKVKLDQVCIHMNELEKKDFDYVIISVKAPYLTEVISSLTGIDGDFKLVSMQNGIDNEEYLARHFGKNRVLRIVVNYAGNMISPGKIKMTFFQKPNYVGCLCNEAGCEHAKSLAKIITNSGLETEHTNEIKKCAWRKTILVAALAPVSAILGMTMAEVLENGESRSLVEKLLKEAIEVAKAQGFDYGESFFGYSLDYLAGAGNHKPSMLIDIEKGHPTEIDFINGKIAYYGHELNIPVETNTIITALVKTKEWHRRKVKNAIPDLK